MRPAGFWARRSAARQALVTQLPVTGEVLRGSLFERTVHHTSGCTICAGAQLRDRSRSVKLRVLEIARAAPRQRSTKRREAGAVLPQITAVNRPGGGSSQALRQADR